MVLLVVNPQFSKFVGELVLDLDVHQHIFDFFGDLESRRSEILRSKCKRLSPYWNPKTNY